MPVLSGCSGDGAHAAHKPGRGASGYTADELKHALLTNLAGYRRAGKPDAGPYSSLHAIRDFNLLQRQVTLDRPQCAGVGGMASSGALNDAPAAFISFARPDGQTLSETLMSVSPSVADGQVKLRVPTVCRSFRAEVGGEWSTNTVVEATGGRPLGQGSRTVGVTTVSGATQVQTWYVVLRSRAYLATVTAYGPAAVQADAERIAGLAYRRAEKILS
jgi:hypothetical protein